MNNDDLFELSEVVRQLLVRVRRNMQLAIDKYQLNLSLQQAHILILVRRPDLNTPMQLACHSGYDKAIITRAIQQLLGQGLLTKCQDDQDKRSILVSITNKGMQVYNQLYSAQLEAHQQVFSELNDDELGLVKTLLQKCI
jgi:MarR family transcriptional repressor of mexAB-oprM operon